METPGNATIKAGDTCEVTRDIVVGGKSVFIKGEQVIIESETPNPQRPEYRFVVNSATIGQRFQLREEDLSIVDMAVPYDSPETSTPPTNGEVTREMQGGTPKESDIETSLGPIKIGNVRRVTASINIDGRVAFRGGEYVKVLQTRTGEDGANEYMVLSPIINKDVWLPEIALSNLYSPRAVLGDVDVDGRLAFADGEQAVIEMKGSHADNPEVKYQAFSQKLGAFCWLPDAAVSPELPIPKYDLRQARMGNVPGKVPGMPKRGKKAPRWVFVLGVVIFSLSILGLFINAFETDSPQTNNDTAVETQTDVTESEDEATSSDASEPIEDEESVMPGSTVESPWPLIGASPPQYLAPGLNPDSEWQLSNIGKSPTISSALGTEQATGIFLVFSVTVRNNSDSEQFVEKVSNLIKVYDSQGKEYSQSDKRFILPEAFKTEAITPGGSISRTAVFDISPGATGLVVRVHGWSIVGDDTAYIELGI